MSKVYKFKEPPDECQVAALKRALKEKRLGIFFEQRVGKSRVAVDFCGCLELKSDIKVAVIVCPLSVVYTWKEQIAQYFPYACDVGIYPETISAREKLLQEMAQRTKTHFEFLVVNYDRLATYRNSEYVEVKRIIKALKPQIVIFDESHLIKNRTSKRHKACFQLAKSAPYRLLLTGTPIAKYFTDIYGQFRVLNETIFGKWTDFKIKYCKMGGFQGKQVVGCLDSEGLSETMARHGVRVLRKDVMDEVSVEDVIVPVFLEKEADIAYENLKKNFVADFGDAVKLTADFAITRLMRLHQLCGGYVTSDDGVMLEISQAKMKATLDLVDTITDGGEQCIIFYKYAMEGTQLVSKLKAKGIATGILNGSIEAEQRNESIGAFQRKNLQVIVVQIQTGCMGVKLDSAHINIFYSLDFSLSNFQQAKDRVMGRGQTKPVTNYFMAVKSTVDTKIIKTLKNNQDVASMITDTLREELGV